MSEDSTSMVHGRFCIAAIGLIGLFVGLLWKPLNGQDNEGGPLTAGEALESYMRDLETLVEHRRKVAELADSSGIEQALAELQKGPLVAASDVYQRLEDKVRGTLKLMSTTRVRQGVAQFAECYAELEHPELAVKILELCPSWELANWLVQAGKFAEAKSTLEHLPPNQREGCGPDLTRKILILEEVIRQGTLTPSLVDELYVREGFGSCRGRAGILVTLWKIIVPPEEMASKLRVLSRLFEEVEDKRGKILALEAMADISEASPEEAGGALVDCGNFFYEELNREKARTYWSRVTERYQGTMAWAIATFNIGYSLREDNRFGEAIQVLQRLIESDANDRDPGGHIMELHRNYKYRSCLIISECYENMGNRDLALDYAYLAWNRHRYSSPHYS